MVIDKFIHITRYPLKLYISNFVEFMDTDKERILDYYLGVSDADKNAFNNLSKLLQQSRDILEQIELHRDRMQNAEFWQLIELLDNMHISLLTIENSSKWLRSAISKNNFNPNVEVIRQLKQLQTLEQLSSDFGYKDNDNQWATIALRNDLSEQDYDLSGGNSLLVGYLGKLTIKLDSVVDNIYGERVYGIDINRIITFENDDLKALSYKQTVIQAVDILTELRYGSTPEFATDGLQTNLIIGENRHSIAYPVIFRQFYQTFRKDDTLTALNITNISNKQDALFIDFTVRTRLGEEIEKTIQL